MCFEILFNFYDKCIKYSVLFGSVCGFGIFFFLKLERIIFVFRLLDNKVYVVIIDIDFCFYYKMLWES